MNFLLKKVRRFNCPGAMRGASMVETLVVIAVFVVISLALAGLGIQLGYLYNLGEAQFDSVGSARAALSGISPYARQARQVVSSTIIDNTTYNTATSTLVLEVPAISENGTIIDAVYDYVVFYTTSTNFYRVLAADSASARPSENKLLANNITDLVFTYSNNLNFAVVTEIAVSVSSTAGNSRHLSEHVQSAQFQMLNY
jgi:hypothetical protein